MAILLRIYALAEFNRFGLMREVVIAEIVDYLKNSGAENEIATEIQSEAKDAVELAPAQKSPQDYASVSLAPPG